ncbi:MAG TPA: methyltransferase domain-containing protein [Ktedonobacterales bacterium]
MASENQTADDERLTEAAARQRYAQWSGQAERYDASRPAAPPALPPLLTQLAHTPRPALVVDLGSGTGLSTLPWADIASEVIGIEPNDDMRQAAERRLARERLAATNVRFVAATAQATGLPDACADIVTASQAFHWMEPTATLAEIARILRPGGVFAAYDHDWPPLVTWEVEALFHDFMDRMFAAARAHDFDPATPGWEKSGHLERLRASGVFRWVKEVTLHNSEPCDADRYIGMSLTNFAGQLIARGILTPEEIGLAAYERETRAAFTTPMFWHVSYRVRLGVR